jgi:hypothetical protein
MKISSNPDKVQTITKLNAACRQLDSAISMYFSETDPIVVHTLACAAHQIIHDINHHKKGPELLFDSVKFKDEFRGIAIQHFHKHYNFFKHTNKDPDPNGEIEFNPKCTEVFMLFAIKGLSHLGVPYSKKMMAFLLYFQILNPKMSELNELVHSSIQVDAVRSIRWVKRSEFFDICLKLWN